METLTYRPLTPSDWPQVLALFGERGACGGCWCMYWRVPRGGKLWQSVKGKQNRESLRVLVESGCQHAILAFDGETPVGWCAFGPRETFPRVERARAFVRDWKPGTWSVVCFFILPKWRRRGVAGELLAAAVARAKALGAREIEGYPAPAKGTLPGAFIYTGVPSLFEKAGFTRIETGAARPLYLLKPQMDTDQTGTGRGFLI